MNFAVSFQISALARVLPPASEPAGNAAPGSFDSVATRFALALAAAAS